MRRAGSESCPGIVALPPLVCLLNLKVEYVLEPKKMAENGSCLDIFARLGNDDCRVVERVLELQKMGENEDFVFGLPRPN